MQKRIHYLDPVSGLCYQAPYMADDNGKIVDRPVTDLGAKNPDSVIKRGMIVIDAPRQKTNFSNKNLYSMMNSQNNFPSPAITPAETLAGNFTVVRDETPGISPAPLKLRISLSNTELTSQTVEIGDPAGLLKYGMTIPDKAAGVIVGGNWTTSTLDILKKITGFTNYRVHKFNIQSYTTAGSASTGFFVNGAMRMGFASMVGDQPVVRQIDLSGLLQPSDFNTNIRVSNDFRFTFSSVTGLIVTIPNGIQVVFDFELHAVGLGQGMLLVDKLGIMGS